MKTGLRVVFDTNTLISGRLWTGAPHSALQLTRTGSFQMLISETLLEEVRDVIHRPQFARFLERNGLTADLFMEELASFAVVINPADITPTVLADPDDDAVWACALGGLADFIVTGDHHLLNLKSYHHIQIVSVHEFLALANPPSPNA